MKIIAYGSLMNKKSLFKTLSKKVKIKKIDIQNFERVFNAPFGDFAYLNLRAKTGGKIEACYFEIGKKDLSEFLKREEGSNLVEIMPGFFAFVWPKEKCAKLPVLLSYIKTCEAGAKNLGIDFWSGTTRPKKIVNDLANPLYENFVE